jgi:2-dehydro-3-deoxygalactonokinase
VRNLVGVDWGTSSLRVARIGADGAVLEERGSQRGILTVPAGGFAQVLHEACGDWLQDPAALCLVSGMAGSRQGWREAPYCACPAGFGELAQALAWVAPGRIAIVPGLSCEDAGVPDVMRGEEVQVFGALALLQRADGCFVLPGTHSKWCEVRGGAVQRFRTCMTGEFYALLRHHSILARMLPEEDGALREDAFLRGVQHAQQAGSLLAAAFSTRTLALFDRMPTEDLPSWLSGLVIGEELRAQAPLPERVALIGSGALTRRYALALAQLGVACDSLGSEATWHGLRALARQLERSP